MDVGCRGRCEDSLVVVACDAHTGKGRRKAHAGKGVCQDLVAKLVDGELDAGLGVDVVEPRHGGVLEGHAAADLGAVEGEDNDDGLFDADGHIVWAEGWAGTHYELPVFY